MSSGQQLFCLNCANIATNGSGTWETFRCMAPENEAGVNLVTGAKIYKIQFCRNARDGVPPRVPPTCGNEAVWYKDKTLALPASKETRQIYGTIKSPEDMGL